MDYLNKKQGGEKNRKKGNKNEGVFSIFRLKILTYLDTYVKQKEKGF